MSTSAIENRIAAGSPSSRSVNAAISQRQDRRRKPVFYWRDERLLSHERRTGDTLQQHQADRAVAALAEVAAAEMIMIFGAAGATYLQTA